ncbi:MAG: SAM-dependent methyltransferase [Leuconostoc pseudomesenteroides]
MMIPYLEQLNQWEEKFATTSDVLFKIQSVKKAIVSLKLQQLPKNNLPLLSFSEKEIFSNFALMPLDDDLAMFRQEIIQTFGIWHIPNQRWLVDLHHFINGRSVLEIMAGNALISAGLRQLQDEVTSTDNFDWRGQDILTPKPWTHVEQEDALESVKRRSFDVLILSWAPDTQNIDWQILTTLRNQRFTGDFIVIGEQNGVTNSPEFWQNAILSQPEILNQNHQPFDTIKDAVWLVK